MKKILLLFLLGLSSCYNKIYILGENSVKIPIRVHVINNYSLNKKAPDLIGEANMKLNGSVFLVADIVKESNKNLPTTFEGGPKMPYYNNDGILDVYMFLRAAVDGDNLGYHEVSGAFIRNRLNACRSFIILSSEEAKPDTLAHEIGHFFGLEHRENDENNVMYPERGWKSEFTEEQLEWMKANAIRWKKRCKVRI